MAKSKRIKSDKPALVIISSWSKVDEVLREVGDLQLAINLAESVAKEKIDEIKADLAEQAKPHQAAIKRHVETLEIFAANHEADFGKKRSRKLNFGSLGWRKSKSISIKKTTLDLIKKVFTKAKAASLLRVKETVDKEALAKLTERQLAKIGARQESKEVFFVEPILTKAVDCVE